MQFKIGDRVRTRTEDKYHNLVGVVITIQTNHYNRLLVRVKVNGRRIDLPYENNELKKLTGIRKIISGCAEVAQ